MTDEICREYRASRSREAAYFLMRLCAKLYTERPFFSTASIKSFAAHDSLAKMRMYIRKHIFFSSIPQKIKKYRGFLYFFVKTRKRLNCTLPNIPTSLLFAKDDNDAG